jgi:hypothetical protein
MLSDEEKREMLEDAHNKERGKSFAFVKKFQQSQKMSGPQFIFFLKSVSEFFGFSAKPHKITGNNFKL